MSIFSAKKISKQYGDKILFENLFLEIDEPKMIFIIGESGAGKSTLLNIFGLLDYPDNGFISIDNKIIIKGEKEDYYRTNDVAFIFQEFNLIPTLTVFENVQLALIIQQRDNNREKVLSLLESLGIQDLADRRIEFLSGGEKQRVTIARALVKNASIILADEPTGNLDKENSYTCMKLLKKSSNNRIVIIVTHDENLAYEFGDEIYSLKNKKLEKIHFKAKEKQQFTISETIKNTNKPRLLLKCQINMIRNYILMKRKRLITSISLLTLSLLIICICGSLLFAGQSLNDDVMVKTLNLDCIKISNMPSSPNIGERNTPLELSYPEAIDYINSLETSNLVKYNKVSLYYETDNGLTSLIKDIININEFWQKRLFEIEGEFLTNDTDIILSSKVAEEYFGNTNCIGETITLRYGNSSNLTYDFIIVGINYNEGVSSEPKSYISSGIANILYIETVQQDTAIYEFYKNNEVTGMGAGLADGINIIYGAMPSENNHVVVDNYVACELLNDLFPEENITPIQIANTTVATDKVDALFSITYESNIMGLNFRISGITDNESTNIYLLAPIQSSYFTQYYYDIMNNYYYTYCDIYLADYSETNRERVLNKLETYNINIDDIMNNYQQSLVARISYIVVIMLIIFILLFIFTISSIYSFSRINAIDKSFDFGILRSLGARKRDIVYNLLIENAIISIIASIISSAIYIIVVSSLPIIIDNMLVDFINIIWFIMPLTLVFAFAVSCLGGIFTAIKTAKMTPATAIRKTN